MSSDFASRKKRTVSDTSSAPEGDHRKRRRNRTTQSCLNCHTSKRMCDRKRPACARCTQLGLTGLCVYEVDDPSQRSDTQDESSRLLKRVAELEGVIRELKNKPHPRWVQSGSSPGEEFEKWHSRSRAGGHEISLSDQPSLIGSPPSSSSLDNAETGSTGSSSASSRSSYVTNTNTYPSSIHLHTDNTRDSPSSHYGSSPLNTPSPSTMTPTEEFSRSHVTIIGQSEVPQDFDLSSMFLLYPSLMGPEDANYAQLAKDSSHEQLCYTKQHGGHCGCLNESTSYNLVLELSLRLRKAADVLARSANHHMGSNCLLNRHISELDTFVTNTLGNISAPPEDMPSPLISQDRSRSNSLTSAVVQPNNVYGSSICRPLPTSAVSPQSLHGLRSWDLMSTIPDSPAACDESFMSWESPRRS